jgi:hypothetical protein
MGEKKNACRLLVGKPERKSPLGKPKPRRVDNIKMDLVQIGRGGVNWIALAQDSYRWCECGNETSDSIKCSETIELLHSWWALE